MRQMPKRGDRMAEAAMAVMLDGPERQLLLEAAETSAICLGADYLSHLSEFSVP